MVGDYKDQQELTRMINKNNEHNLASKAEQAGGQLKMVKAPPVLLPADAKKKAKEEEQRAKARQPPGVGDAMQQG